MKDIRLDSTHDISVSDLDMGLTDGVETIRQQVDIKLNLWRGEWFLDTEFGTPYLQSILGKQITLQGAIAAIRTSVKQVPGVVNVSDIQYKFDPTVRKLSLTFSVDTNYGKIEVET